MLLRNFIKAYCDRTFEDELQLVGEYFERADAGSVLGYDVFLVPRTAGKLEKVLARIGRPIHSY